MPIERFMLRESRISISDRVIDALENLKYIGELRQRWNEIKKLQVGTFAIS